MVDENTQQEQQESFVLIKFAGLGIAEFEFVVRNVSPAQILGATTILEVYAKNAYIQEENERRERVAQTQLSVPKGKIEIGRK